MRILVVDDDRTYRYMVSKILTGIGYNVVVACDGLEALNIILQPDSPELIILDWIMPGGMDGIDVLREIRASSFVQQPYIIMLTGQDGAAEKLAGLNAGANDYICKPFDVAELRARVDVGCRAVASQNALFLYNPVSFMIHDADSGEVLEANKAALESCGCEKINHFSLDHICKAGAPFTSDVMLQHIRQARDGGNTTFEWKTLNSAGGILWEMVSLQRVEFNGKMRVLSNRFNVTRQKEQAIRLDDVRARAEAQLSFPRKLEELGEKEFLLFVQEVAEDLTGSQVAFIYFVNESEQTSQFISWSRRTTTNFCKATYADHYPLANAGIWADAVRERRPVVINDYPSYPKKRGVPEGHAHLDRFVSVPVFERGKVVMLMGVGNKKVDYTDYDVETLQTLANEIWTLVQRQREQVLAKQNEERFMEAMYTSEDAILLLGQQVVSDCNEAAARMLGYPERSVIMQLPKGALSPPRQPDGTDSLEKAAEMMQRAVINGFQRFEWILRKADGLDFPVEVSMTPIVHQGRSLLHCSWRDLSRQRAMEAELVNARKLEAVGQLAAGIAHEINTPTQFVGDNIRFLKDSFDGLLALVECYRRMHAVFTERGTDPEMAAEAKRMAEAADLEYLVDEVPKALEQSIDGVRRVASIVQAMKDFSHPPSLEKELADLNRAIETTATVARNEWKYVADLEMNLSPNLPHVPCLVSEINQVFLNLIVNAAHAIEETGVKASGKKGTIRIATGQEGRDVVIRVSDTGTGIKKEHQSRLFELFFTTKSVGKGTGQGLSIVYQVVTKKHGGSVSFETEEGKGTTFIIRLPLDMSS